MDYIQITKDNIEKEHICCAMSGKQSVMKRKWLKQRFAEGLVFYRSTERGKCFIEYIPAERMGPDSGGRICLYRLFVGIRFPKRTRIRQ